MLQQKQALVNQARRIIATARLFEGGARSAQELEEECQTYIILSRDNDPDYLAHLETWINDRINDSQLDLFDDGAAWQ